MSELLLIDWDNHEARLVIGSASGSSLRVDQVEVAVVEGDASPAAVAAALRPLVEKHLHGKRAVVVVLGGRDVQSRLLRVPPVPADELPDLIRLRANTEFPATDDTAVIDFVPIEEQAGQATTVLVARMAAKTIAAAREVCQKLQLTPDAIAMRGCGVALLTAAHAHLSTAGVGLTVVRRGDELDLVGTQAGQAVLVRTVALPGDADAESLAQAATREIRRTIAAIGSELVTNDVDTIAWIVGGAADQQLADRCGRELSRRVQQVAVADVGAGDVVWPEGAAAFAGIIGTATALGRRSLPVNFLAPRKAAENKTPATTYALAAALAALLLLGGGWMAFSSVASLEREAAVDIEERQAIEADLEDRADEVRYSQDVEQWLATDVNWLDEIDRIAQTLRPLPLDNHDEFQPDRDVRLTSLLARKSSGKGGTGGVVALAGSVRDDQVLEEIEDQLRGPGRQVNPESLIYESQDAPYVWSFQNNIVVAPDEEERR